MILIPDPAGQMKIFRYQYITKEKRLFLGHHSYRNEISIETAKKAISNKQHVAIASEALRGALFLTLLSHDP